MTKASAARHLRAGRAQKKVMLDVLCALRVWYRDHARRALRDSLVPTVVAPRKPREPLYGHEVVVGLGSCWAVMGAPASKRMAPFLPELVTRLRGMDELDISDDTATKLCVMWLPRSTGA